MSLADELKKLAELKDAGVLTQDEFDAQKQKLLADDGVPDKESIETLNAPEISADEPNSGAPISAPAVSAPETIEKESVAQTDGESDATFFGGLSSFLFGALFFFYALGDLQQSGKFEGDTAVALIVSLILVRGSRKVIERALKTQLSTGGLWTIGVLGFVAMALLDTTNQETVEAAEEASESNPSSDWLDNAKLMMGGKVESAEQAAKCIQGTWNYDQPSDRKMRVIFKENGTYEFFVYSKAKFEKHHQGHWEVLEGYYSNTQEAYFGPKMTFDLSKNPNWSPAPEMLMLGSLCARIEAGPMSVGGCDGALDTCSGMQINIQPNIGTVVFEKNG